MRRYRTVWISDIHLGTRGCKAKYLLQFLESIQTDKLYLVGDIIDLWKLKSGWYWPETHNRVVQKIIQMARDGTEVIFIPGNHDEWFRDHLNISFGDIMIRGHDTHITADGKRLWVIHGDQFDFIVRKHKWVARIGSHLYDWLLIANNGLNAVRRACGLDYWSLSAYVKAKAKAAANVIENFNTAVANSAKKKGMDGVVCGHIHQAEIRTIDGILYCNDGDWVESCTALVEHHNGELEIVREI